VKNLSLPAALLACFAAHAGDTNNDRANKDHGGNAATAFARLKTLAGEWEADTEMGKVHLTYELIAGSNVLTERFSSEKMPVMLTVYHLDGKRLLLEHYCMAGNQPRMQAKPFRAGSEELEFEFLDATNLASPGAGHMHSAKIRFLDNNHLVSEWQYFENGQRKFTETAQYARVQ
jgi:hypothetical protein